MTISGKILRLGTRKSLLAWAQSSWVASRIEQSNPGLRVELVGLETQGDRIQDVPLSKIEGKEFFVAELDEALRTGAVDLCVHSLKDLSLERPQGFVCAAIPERENPRDVVLFGPQALARLRAGKELLIGTSSPRRIENIPRFLKRALPQPCKGVRFIEIRGNVNTRLSRVHESPDHPKYVDGVVLAFAGLIRLWRDDQARLELARLLQGVRWMVLPLKENPTAPGQGALAVECRESDGWIQDAIGKIHHPDSATRVAVERELLKDWGGGCHQRFGASAFRHSELGELLFVRGAKMTGEAVDELRWQIPKSDRANGNSKIFPWDGTKWRLKTEDLDLLSEDPISPVFIAHSRSVRSDNAERFRGTRIWTSGAMSWFRLAEQGLWIEGCADGLGTEHILSTLAEPILQLPALQDWTVATHEGAHSSWSGDLSVGEILSTYRLSETLSDDASHALATATHAYWSSGSQFNAAGSIARKVGHHSCGPGKTASHLRAHGVEPKVFPSVEEWRKWLT